jgi:hypothetical protein
MRAAVLIIGSLYWRRDKHRAAWRKANLDLARKIFVQVPIRYRRRSSTKTYTMGFAARGHGTALVVPCKSPITNLAALVKEAQDLWGAETNSDPRPGVIATGWGSVAVLFRRGLKQSALARNWAGFFEKNRVNPDGENPISREGYLKIPWPKNATGRPVKFDVLLATSNVIHNPSIKRVATAWLAHGHEDYFFENVAAGIRTPLDRQIWRYMARAKSWREDYPVATQALKSTAAKR